MFLGQYLHNLDGKGRLMIPVRYRPALEAGVYATQGFDGNIMLWPVEAFEKIAQRVNQASITDPSSRLLRRLIYSSSDKLELDKAGRILLPDFLRHAAGLDSAVMVVGVGDYLEIWSPALWEGQQAMLVDSQANAGRFSAFDLAAG
ncbi:MAG: division/cell wall cluster transcriptional repressor MraZ [Chloroflexi bacterium]|nr:division/cell wall cluster transcriptional repressor MraZ [Chloroflexota bacterium]